MKNYTINIGIMPPNVDKMLKKKMWMEAAWRDLWGITYATETRVSGMGSEQ